MSPRLLKHPVYLYYVETPLRVHRKNTERRERKRTERLIARKPIDKIDKKNDAEIRNFIPQEKEIGR